MGKMKYDEGGKKKKLTPLEKRAKEFLNSVAANEAKLKLNTPGRKMKRGGASDASYNYKDFLDL